MRRKMGSTAVKRAIIVAMVAMLTISQPMMTYASENTQTFVDDHGHDDDVATHVKSTDSEYTDTAQEAKTAHDSADSVKAMEEQVKNAQAAAEDAANMVSTIQKEVVAASNNAASANAAASIATSAVAAANAGAGNAEEAARNAATIASSTSSMVDNVTNAASSYNSAVVAAQVVVDSINAGKTIKVDSAGAVNSAGTMATDTAEYVADQAKKAAAAAAEAKKALENAIAVDTTAVNDEVRKHAQEAKAAAGVAEAAAQNAKDAYSDAKKNFLMALAQYNAQATLYGEKTITVDENFLPDEGERNAYEDYRDDAMNMLQRQTDIAASFSAATAAAKCASVAVSTDGEQMAVAATQVKAAADSFDIVSKQYDATKKSAEAAAAAAQQAQDQLAKDNTKAQNAADAVNNYYVTPAANTVVESTKSAADKQEAADQKQQAFNAAQTDYAAAVTAAQEEGRASYGSDLKKYTDAIDKAQKDVDNAKDFWERLDCKSNLKQAQIEKKWFEQWNSADDYAEAAVKKSVDVKEKALAEKTAEIEYNSAKSQSDVAQKQLMADQSALATATATKKDYLDQIDAAYQAGETQGMLDTINQGITERAVKINQVEFDKDLNEWANGFMNTVAQSGSLEVYLKSLDEKDKVQDYIDKTYDIDNAVKKFFNDSQLSQWAISTDDTDKVMQLVSDALKAQIVKKYEFMATANANFAKYDTEKAYAIAFDKTNGEDIVEAAKTKVDGITEIDPAAQKVAIESAKTRLDDAQQDYKDAKDNLAAAEKKLAGISLNRVDLSDLKSKIDQAKAALATAKDQLDAAQASAAAATNYSNWAQALIGNQNTLVYAQAEKDADGIKVPVTSNIKDYDTSDPEVKTRKISDFVSVSGEKLPIPYTIYRAFVSAMYDQYNYTDVAKAAKETRGKGAALNSQTQSIVFWEVNNDNQLTGKYYFSSADGSAPADMPSGTYFIGYTVKHETSGYHMDGTMYQYKQPETPVIPPVTPTVNPTTTTTGTVTTTTAATTIAEAATPLAAIPAVLGARRAPSVATVETAATAQTPAVLGAARSRATGDSTHDDLRLIVTLAGAAGAAGLFAAEKRKKAQKKEQ